MTTLAPKNYQLEVLESVEGYFKACHELPSPSIDYRTILGAGFSVSLAGRFPSGHAVLLFARPNRRGENLVGREERGTREHALATP